MNNNNFILCCVLSEVGRNGKPVFRLVYQVFSSVLKSTSISRMFVVLTQPEECVRLLLQVKEPLPTHSLVLFFIFYFFNSSTWDIWTFPGQVYNQSYSCKPVPQAWQCGIWPNYTAACGKTGFLTSWARPRIEPTLSGTLC